MLGTSSKGVLIHMPDDLTFHSHPSDDLLEIYALRGVEATANVAAANAQVQLSWDLIDLPPAPGYTVELVDQRGITKWDQHDVPPAGTKLPVDLTRPLIPGQYWVRLYPNALKNELLREFSLLVK